MTRCVYPPVHGDRASDIAEGSSSSATTSQNFAQQQRAQQSLLKMVSESGWRGNGIPDADGRGGGSMTAETERGSSAIIPNPGGRGGVAGGMARGPDTLGGGECIVLDGDSEEEEEEVQFLGEGQALAVQPRQVEAQLFHPGLQVQPAIPLLPATPRPLTSSYAFQPCTPTPTRPSSQLHTPTPPRPSSQLHTPTPPHPSSQKRKLNSLDAASTPSRPAPRQRQAASAQSLSKLEWTFGGEQRRSTESASTEIVSAAVEEALSPFSTPTNTSRRDRRDSMSRSINRSEGYEVVDMPAGDGVVNGGSEAPARAGKRTEIGKFRIAAAAMRAQITPPPAKNKEVDNLLLNGYGFASMRDVLATTGKGKSGGNLGGGGEIVGAVEEQLTPTAKSGSNLGGSEVVGSVKDQITPTTNGKIVSFHITDEVATATRGQPRLTRKSKNSDVDQDWEVIEVGASKDRTYPFRLSIPRKPVIDLEDYEFLPTLSNTASNPPITPITPTIIDSSDSESEFEFEIISSHTLTPQPRRRSTIYPLRNPPITHPLYIITATIISTLSLTISTVVELSDGDFLQITDLIRNIDTGAITLCGHRFQRTRDLNGLLAKKRNELCWVTEVDDDDERPAAVQSLSEVPGSSVTRVRKALITNMAFPAATYRNIPPTVDPANVENEGIVAVRWKYTTTWPGAKERVNNENAFCERVLRHLGEGDALVGDGLRIRDELAREQFRGPTVKGGSFSPPVRTGWLRQRLPTSRSEKLEKMFSTTEWYDDDMVDLTDELPKTPTKSRLSVAEATQERMLGQIDLTTPELSLPPSDGTVRATNAASLKKTTIKRVKGQMYTYGDAFCGAGGATRGAHTAGLKVVWGFDFNAHACETWRLNFPSATLYPKSAFDVCEQWASEAQAGHPNRAQVDILHISPPCQFFSPAHTIAGKDDEMNTASLLACGRLLALVRPRVVTLEQTFGIGHAEFTRWFNALIHQFTDNGYSLRWKICHLQDWGLPQRRQRLIIIAACPGEPLPPFPPYTHSRHPTPGLKPYTSVNTLLATIPPATPNHDLASALSKTLYEPPWDGTSIAPRAITTHGGQNYHPSGTRGLTNRELAVLQGFPLGHVFGERNVKKQIGNAVPPSVAAVLFGQVRRVLEEGDGVERVVVVVD